MSKEKIQLCLSSSPHQTQAITPEIANFLQKKTVVSVSLAGAKTKQELKDHLKTILSQLQDEEKEAEEEDGEESYQSSCASVNLAQSNEDDCYGII